MLSFNHKPKSQKTDLPYHADEMLNDIWDSKAQQQTGKLQLLHRG
jgi:hypothetical protein